MKTVAINLEGFIIPNNAGVVVDYNIGDTSDYLRAVGKLNGIEISDNDKVVSMWLVGGESNNVARHGFNVEIDGQEVEIYNYNMEYIPAKILEGCTEGSLVKYSVPCRSKYIGDTGEITEFILEVSMICKQQTYRYADRGKFEEVLNLVTSDKKKESQKKEEEKGMFGKIKEKWNGMSTTKKGVITIVGFAAVGALAKFAIYKALEDNHESNNDVETVAASAEETLIDVGSDDIIE